MDSEKIDSQQTPQQDERKNKAKQYEKIHNLLFLADIIFTLIVLAVFIFGGYSAGLSGLIGQWCGNYWGKLAIYVTIITTVYYIMLMPFSFYSGYVLEHKYQLSNQSFLPWLKDKGKSYILNVVFMLVMAFVLYLFFIYSENLWWLWVGIAWVLFGIILSNIAPVLIIPLFYKLKPLEDKALSDRLINLAGKVKAKILGVYEIDLSEKTKKANAALAGLGNTKRILLGDTLLKNFSYDEIEVILAHELGHFYHKHIVKLIFFGSAITFGGLFLTSLVFSGLTVKLGYNGITDIAGFPVFLLCMFVFTIISTPLNSTYSRVLEYQADLFAFKQTMMPGHFISSMQKLAEMNLADDEPNPVIEFLLHDHPGIAKRIAAARRFIAENPSAK